MKSLYRGSLVRLASVQPDLLAKSLLKWDRDSEAQRLGDFMPVQLQSEKKIKEYLEKREENNTSYRFSILTLAGDVFIGFTSLWVNDWNLGEAWLGIFIGERDYWGKGYGTDAMRLIVQYGFMELNLRRISLGLHAFNERALKSYLKVGFRVEGRERGVFLRDGVRYDDLVMGLLREEWLEMQNETNTGNASKP
ncbi:MAG TPA: GNAT family protein [Anaerolineales bacterium]|nr:GNAT family protein [Anaerolineales bacterium]HNN12090.1 GNAT family protein [Anaerolineales bacterium]